LSCHTCAAYARDLVLELFALYAVIAFNNNKEKEKEEEKVKDKKSVLTLKLKATLKEQAF
jgi:hypothetical protein